MIVMEVVEMKYRKKPVVVEAFKYDGDLMNSSGNYYVPEWAVKALKNGVIFFKDAGDMYIKTLEGDMFCAVGDYVIKEPFPTDNRTVYPCKPDIFEATYEKVD